MLIKCSKKCDTPSALVLLEWESTATGQKNVYYTNKNKLSVDTAYRKQGFVMRVTKHFTDVSSLKMVCHACVGSYWS